MLLTGESLANRRRAEDPAQVIYALHLPCPASDDPFNPHDAVWTMYYWERYPVYYDISCEVCDR